MDKIYLIILLLLLSFFYSSTKVFEKPIKIWDEAIYGNNAIEMAKNNNYLVLKNNNKPSFYNTKPPMMIWFQSIFIKIFGISEFSVRLPSILSVLLLMIFLFKFIVANIKHGHILAFSTGLILISAPGFMGYHIGMTGDLDALLCLWITLYSLCIFKILLADDLKKINAQIYLFSLLVIGGFLTKSVASLILLPGLFICVFFSDKKKKILANKHTYFAALLTGAFIAGYYFLMANINPGYFEKAWFSEYKRFYTNIMPWHDHPYFFYFKNLLARFSPWIYFFPLGIILGLKSSNIKIRKITLYSLIVTLEYLLIVSIPKIKLEWYDAPIYPYLSLITGIFFHEVISSIKHKCINFKKNEVAFSLTLLILFSIPYYKAIAHNNVIGYYEPLEREGVSLKKIMQNDSYKNINILMQVEHEEHYDHLNFYRKEFYYEKGLKSTILSNINQVKKGDTVLVCQIEKIDSLKNKYSLDTIKKVEECYLLKIRN